jgi:Ser/Thr protein kinase RdoA (MazF antagonist)
MESDDVKFVADALGGCLVSSRRLAGGFSHETRLLTLADRQVVARFGGPSPDIEAAVMTAARLLVPVPQVLLVRPASDETRSAMVIEHVAGSLLSEVLATEPDLGGLGAEVGGIVAMIGSLKFERPGFFADAQLTIPPEHPWSEQLPQIAAACMATTNRLDTATRSAWLQLCEAHAPALARIDSQARLVHADVNPKNFLVERSPSGWHVTAVLDWEFSYSGCPYGDAANMVRFAADYPRDFVDGFLAGFRAHQPADLPLPDDWLYLGRVLDMFALSDLVTRPAGHPIADQAADLIRTWIGIGVPGG